MSTVILGAHGQVGRHLARVFPEATVWTRSDLDLANQEHTRFKLFELAPNLIINAAAYTKVDEAEDNRSQAFQINQWCPATLAQTASGLNARLVHFSTDYVFDGEKAHPYIDSDVANPKSIYGLSKRAGELSILETACDHWIIRVAWVFSEYGSNFVKTISRLLLTNSELRVVNDQRGTPTYAGDIAAAVRQLSTKRDLGNGIYHLAGGGAATWYEFACEIKRKLVAMTDKALAEVIPIKSVEYATRAPRPHNSVLETSRNLMQSLEKLPNWEGRLEGCLRNLDLEL